jgi:hypothetical protein
MIYYNHQEERRIKMIVYLVWFIDYDGVTLEGVYANAEKAKEVVKDLNDGDLDRRRLPYAIFEPWEVEN